MEAEPAVAAAEPSAEPEAAGVVLDVTADNSARLQELVRQAEEQAQQLELEGRTRAELEDVLQRIERHFRSEQVARRRAEETEREATEELVRERELRVRLEEELRTRCAETKETSALHATLEAEHAAVEEDYKRVEQELAAARSEAKKALATLAKTEEAVRQMEAMERLKLEAEHNARMNKLSAELDCVREELDIRTRVIGAELVRWRAQAEAAAAAVRDAKDELMDRKRELDVTKERMDGLVEKLYVGREKGLELRGAIESHLERFQQQRSLAPQVAASSPAPQAGAAGAADAAEITPPAAAEEGQRAALDPDPDPAPAYADDAALDVAAGAVPAVEQRAEVAEAAPPPQRADLPNEPRRVASARPAVSPAGSSRGYAHLSRAASQRAAKPNTPS